MSLGTDLYAHLVAQAGITSQISTRLYPRRAPSTATGKYVVYNRLDGNPSHSHGGAMCLTQAIYEFIFFADEPADVEAVAEAFRNELDGLTGTINSGTDVRRIWLIDERDGLVDLDDSDEEGKERITHNYEIFYNRTIPTL